MLIEEAPSGIAWWDDVLIEFVHVAPLTAPSTASEPLLVERTMFAASGTMPPVLHTSLLRIACDLRRSSVAVVVTLPVLQARRT
jgi:hypothetical protein